MWRMPGIFSLYFGVHLAGRGNSPRLLSKKVVGVSVIQAESAAGITEVRA